MTGDKRPEEQRPVGHLQEHDKDQPEQDEPDVTMANAGEGGPGEDPDYDEAGEGDDGIDDRR